MSDNDKPVSLELADARAQLQLMTEERDELLKRCQAVKKLGIGWIGFDDSHGYGDKVLMALAPLVPWLESEDE